MAFSSSVPFLVAHQHSLTVGDGGILDRNLTNVNGLSLIAEMFARGVQGTTGHDGVITLGPGVAVSMAVH